ncbi:MAG: rod shape-determining protein [Acidobacteria bacterium]|mgnify:CR=1 FL=1|nr:MAG: rod shape-determining protein [Acidobacteriota bacterium]REK02920.1 MAG: rod shape-determining protein [Acidobacteriota bacterium]REK13276.1 MAG: rod shape-determining protein [Acidobacteriota bacterium]REK41270.1 MAG: rod shape-determining protein [Acidobacteriota bacterium]
MALSSLKKLVTNYLAIDMGTANTVIAVRGRDVVVDEPSLVAVSETKDEIVAVGIEAAEMRGREGRDIVVVAPLSAGVVADYEKTKHMLASFVKKAKSGGSQVTREAVLSVLSDITHVEQRAMLNAAEESGIGKVYMVEEGLAAAFGVGVDPADKRASAVVDIGSASTNIAVVTKGVISHSKSERLGSDEINEAITLHIKRNLGLQIGTETAEEIKRNFVSAVVPEDLEAEMQVRGRDLQTGSPHAVTITAGEVYPIAERIVRRIAEVVKDTLTELRPEIAADIYDRGIVLTGGGALLRDVDKYIREFIDLSVIIPDEPRYASVRGLLKMFDVPEHLERVARNEPGILADSEVSFET